MSSSSLLDFAVDLINDAKSAQDSKKKLYLLDQVITLLNSFHWETPDDFDSYHVQVKEIVLHREKAIMKDLAPTIFDFMSDKTMQIRKFLIKFSSDAMTVPEHMPLIFPSFLNLVVFLMHDASDGLLLLIVKEFHKFYDKMIMAIVLMPQQTTIKGTQG